MIVTFENFRLDTDSYHLSQAGQSLPVEPQVFAVLQVLIENRHRVVTKDDLIQTVWQGRIMSDAAISSRIKSARQALNDDGRTQRLIKTVHGVGFRFVGEIDALPSSSTVISATGTAQKSVSDAADGRPSIIVLPFNLPPNSPPSIVPQGLAHDVIAALSRLRWLKVISRSSAFRVANGSSDLNEICKLTNIRYCLSGFITFESEKVVLHYELSEIQGNAVLFADQITMRRSEINELRMDITKQLIATLEVHISENEAQMAQLKSTENLDAWEAYHLATMHLFRFTASDNQLAVSLFNKAIQLEPQFARAHAGLSAAEFQNAFNLYQGIDRKTSIAAAIASAEKSIGLDKFDPLANFVMGRTHWLKGETEKSLAWLERALALNPNYAHGYYAHGLASLMSNSDIRSYQDSEKAVSLSPLDPFLYGFYGIRAFSYLADEDIENARIWAEKAALQPESIVIMDLLAAAICEMSEDKAAANKWLEKARVRFPEVDGHYFFKSLPFSTGKIRTLLQSSFKRMHI